MRPTAAADFMGGPARWRAAVLMEHTGGGARVQSGQGLRAGANARLAHGRRGCADMRPILLESVADQEPGPWAPACKDARRP